MESGKKKILYLDGGGMPAVGSAMGALVAHQSVGINLNEWLIWLISGSLPGAIAALAGLPPEESVKIYVHDDISSLFTWRQNPREVLRRMLTSIRAKPADQLQHALYGLLGTERLGQFYDKLFEERGLKIPPNFSTMTVSEGGGRIVIGGEGICAYHSDGSCHKISQPPQKIGPIVRAAITIPWVMEARRLRDVLFDSCLDKNVLRGTPYEHAFALDGCLVADPTDTIAQHYNLDDKSDITVFSSNGLSSRIIHRAYILLAHYIPGLPRLPHCNGFEAKKYRRLIEIGIRFGLLKFKATSADKLLTVFDAYDAMMNRFEEADRPSEDERQKYKLWLAGYCGCELPHSFNPHPRGSHAFKRWHKRHRAGSVAH